jgi:arylsulfatase
MKMEIHAAMVDRMDREVGRVVEQLREMGELDNTVIFFLSDNGCSAEIMIRGNGHDPQAAPGSAFSYYCLGPGWSTVSNTPFRRHKVWVHEGGIASPLIVHWPAGLKGRGEVRHTVGHVIDIAPTLVELAGGQWPREHSGVVVPAVEGRSLVPSFQADCSSDHECLWWLHEGNRALRCGDWKIVAAKNDPWELYNLAEDRAETVNLAELHPETVARLADRWQAKLAAIEQQVFEQLPRPTP